MPSFECKFEYSKVRDSADFSKLQQILSQCFMMSPTDSESYADSVGIEKFRILRQDQQIVGGGAILPFGQCWGGEFVPMAGIAAVGIAPEYRGSGAANSIMESVVKEIYDEGVPISVLFPAVQGLYRNTGYEQAGNFCNWEIKTASIQVGKPELPLTSVSCESVILQQLHHNFARSHNGNLERNSIIWAEIARPRDSQQIYAYLIGASSHPQGYIIFTQHRSETSDDIYVKDWVLLTPKAIQTFWAFLSSHRSQIDTVRYRSALVDVLTLVLPEQTAKLTSMTKWMLRIVDVVKALERRGYAQNIQAELHLEIQDDLLPQNNNRFILAVANGHGQVTIGGKGELKTNIRAFAPLYTGLFTPRQLQLTGKLEATENAITSATQIFTGFTGAGASPWMADFF
ncbi:MAG: GNAT family N-acetyltransferase [Calothrix sp. C42_A2020_038]|nr:GNAT family N-acetyltransferase [Calothrix sp. C42_A2020_038]